MCNNMNKLWIKKVNKKQINVTPNSVPKITQNETIKYYYLITVCVSGCHSVISNSSYVFCCLTVSTFTTFDAQHAVLQLVFLHRKRVPMFQYFQNTITHTPTQHKA
jgi:hypothetical protein